MNIKPIPTTDEEWRQKLKVDSNVRLVSSSMWSTRSLASGNELVAYMKNECKFALVNSLEMSSRIKINFCVFWKPIGSNSQSDSDKKRIAYFISELPSESFLHELKDTDQLAVWTYKKNFAIRLAKCWEAGNSTPDNPLIVDMEKGLIDQWECDDIWLETSYYEQIWKLLQQRGRKVLKSLKEQWDCPFNSERELMQELLKEAFDNEYSPLLKEKHIHKNSDTKELGKLARQGSREALSEAKHKELTDLRRQLGGETFWHNRLGDVVRTLAKKDSWIRSWLKTIRTHEDATGAMLESAACDPKLRAIGHGRSFASIDGRIYPNLRKLPR